MFINEFIILAFFTQILVAVLFAPVEYIFLDVLFVAAIANNVSEVGIAIRLFVVRIHLMLIRTVQVYSVLDKRHAILILLFFVLILFVKFLLEASSADVLVAFPVASLEATDFFVDAFLSAYVTRNTAAERMEQVVHQIVIVFAFGLFILFLFRAFCF